MVEVSGLVKFLLWALAFVAGLYLLALRPWRPKAFLLGLSPSVDLFFLAILALATLSLMESQPFEAAAGYVIAHTSLPDGLAQIDITIAELEDTPTRLWAELVAQLGFGDPPPPAATRWPTRPGPVEATIVTAVGEIISMTLRAYTYLACLTTLWMTLVMRLFMRSSAARRMARDAAFEDLEQRLALVSGAPAPPRAP